MIMPTSTRPGKVEYVSIWYSLSGGWGGLNVLYTSCYLIWHDMHIAPGKLHCVVSWVYDPLGLYLRKQKQEYIFSGEAFFEEWLAHSFCLKTIPKLFLGAVPLAIVFYKMVIEGYVSGENLGVQGLGLWIAWGALYSDNNSNIALIIQTLLKGTEKSITTYRGSGVSCSLLVEYTIVSLQFGGDSCCYKHTSLRQVKGIFDLLFSCKNMDR